MIGTRKILIAVALAAIAAGCAKPEKVVIAPRLACDFTPFLTKAPPSKTHLVPPVAGTMAPMPLDTVSIADIGITNKVLVQEVSAQRTETGTLKVWTRVANCTDFPLQVEGRTHFLDAAKAPVEPPTAWQRVHLSARTLGVYTEVSTATKQAASYLIEIREGR